MHAPVGKVFKRFRETGSVVVGPKSVTDEETSAMVCYHLQNNKYKS